MDKLKETIRQSAEKWLTDLLGFAARNRFKELAAEKNPFTLFPEARTCIVIGRRITRGTLRGVEEGVNFGDYSSFGRGWLADEFVTETLYNVALDIERAGFEAMPLTPGPHRGVPGVSEPCNPDFEYAAVAAGLGEIGMSGTLLTPRFGPRQRVAIILTDAELESDPLWDAPICTKCGKCAKICPLDAMGPNTYKLNVAGKVMDVYEQNYHACEKCGNGAVKMGYLNTIMTGAVRSSFQSMDRLAAVCTRTCVAALEDADVLENKFDMKFRQREVWRKNEYGEVLPPVKPNDI